MNRSTDDSECFENSFESIERGQRIWLERGISPGRYLRALALQSARGSKIAEAKDGDDPITPAVRSLRTILSVPIIVLMVSAVATPLQAVAGDASQVTAIRIQSMVESYQPDGLDDYADDLSRFERPEISDPYPEQTSNGIGFNYEPVTLCRLFHYVQSVGNDAFEWRKISDGDFVLPAYYKTDPCDHLLPGNGSSGTDKKRNAISKLDAATLRKLFRQAQYNVSDGLDDYGEDLTMRNKIDEHVAGR
jgi:hypothetical protein